MTNEKHKCHLGLHTAEMQYIVTIFKFKILNGGSKTYFNLIYILRSYTIHPHTRLVSKLYENMPMYCDLNNQEQIQIMSLVLISLYFVCYS